MPDNTGGPAFPAEVGSDNDFIQTGIGSYRTPGMTLRDYFAAKAMASLVTHRDLRDSVDDIKVAKEAYGYADAMMAARGA